MSEKSVLLGDRKRGAGVECTGFEPAFTMTIRPEAASVYHFIGNELSWGEVDTTAVSQSVGGDIFMYCTGAQQVSLTVSGVIIYPECPGKTDDKKFRKFWNTYRIGTYKKLLEIELDGDVYYMALMQYSRMPSAQESDVDVVRMTFVGVAAKNDEGT